MQFTTTDGSLTGAIDGVNATFAFQPYPATLLYTPPAGMTGALLFRNGLLQDEYRDYGAGSGYFALTADGPPQTMTAMMYTANAPTRLRATARGLSFTDPVQDFQLTPLTPLQAIDADCMVFRNGQLLTRGRDYTQTERWFVLLGDQVLLTGDSILALTAMGGSEASTFDGLITGTINSVNAVFGFPFAPKAQMLFRNGQLLTLVKDYTISGATITLLGDQIPIAGDTLTARLYSPAGPQQISTYDGSLSYPVAIGAMLYRNGLLMTQPVDGITHGDTATLFSTNVPYGDDVITVRALTPDFTDAEPLPFNLSTQFTTLDGSITGAADGFNNIFALTTNRFVTQVVLMRNGVEQAFPSDYGWGSSEALISGPWVTTITTTGIAPQPGDWLTAEVYFS